MIQHKTKLNVADNSGAKTVECIRSSVKNSTHACVGQLITVSVKTVTGTSKVKKGAVYKALIVRTKSPIKRPSGHVVSFSDNAVVLMNPDAKGMVGTRVFGMVATEIRRRFMPVVSVAKEII